MHWRVFENVSNLYLPQKASTCPQSRRYHLLQNKGKDTEGDAPNAGKSEDSHSETTIYKNVLDKVENVIVDHEVSFRIKDKRDGTSSVDRLIDTSDELMALDEHDRFIAEMKRQQGGRKVMIPDNQMQNICCNHLLMSRIVNALSEKRRQKESACLQHQVRN